MSYMVIPLCLSVLVSSFYKDAIPIGLGPHPVTLFHLACMYPESLQSSQTLCDSMDCSPPGSSVHGDSPGKNTGVGCHALLQGIFPTQGLNLCVCIDKWLLCH